MSDTIIVNIGRFIGIFLLQVLILINVDINTSYVNIYLYPLLILLLPINASATLILFLSFALGLSVDLFYDTMGIHAATSVFTAFLRPLILRIFEPRGGYEVNQIPSKHHFGLNWFLQYVSVLFGIHLFIFFLLEAFSFAYFGTVLLKTLLSFLFSIPLFIIYSYIFNPKN